MRLPTVSAVLALSLAACASPPREDVTAPVNVAAYDGGIALAVIGTPIYAVSKATTCVATALIAAPSSAFLALTDRPNRNLQREALQEGVGRNCGGRYWLAPAG